jgi:hypothetical protein
MSNAMDAADYSEGCDGRRKGERQQVLLLREGLFWSEQFTNQKRYTAGDYLTSVRLMRIHLLVGLTVVAHGVAAQPDCSLNGEKNAAGDCMCDKPWSGPVGARV